VFGAVLENSENIEGVTIDEGSRGRASNFFAIQTDKRCARSSEIWRWPGPVGKSLNECYEACKVEPTCAYFASWPEDGQASVRGRNHCRIYRSPCEPHESLAQGFHDTLYQIQAQEGMTVYTETLRSRNGGVETAVHQVHMRRLLQNSENPPAQIPVVELGSGVIHI